jgi:predicted xylose isomerase-like sugar epimerase
MAVERDSERDRLIKRICEFTRMQAPRLPIDEFFRFRTRLSRTRVEVLREILEQDVVNTTAVAILPRGLAAR